MSRYVNSAFKINLLLFLCSFSIYFFYFHEILLHPNAILSSVSGDSLKNYYSYVFHIKNDPHFLSFSGLNYPYGEHIVYTDCQPLLTLILRLLPFTHDYLIGVLHLLIFLSFIVTPLLLNAIFIRLKLDRFPAFFISLAITLLSPQYSKVLGGHYALAYACIIPLCILLLLRLFQNRTRRSLCELFLFNFLLFFIHPYFGFGTSLFSFISVLIFELFPFSKRSFVSTLYKAGVTGIVPIILFKIFMVLSDQHIGRPVEPENVNMLTANMGSLLLPHFGPLRGTLPEIFKVRPSNFEGYAYLGIFSISLVLVFLILLPFLRKKIVLSREAGAIFIAALFLLFFAFGLHNDLLSLLHIKIAALDQFRASGRFIWFFYYSLPVFLVPLLFNSFRANFPDSKNIKPAFKLIAILYFSCNLWEAHFLFRHDREAFWKFDNFFNADLLSPDEKKQIETIRNLKPQAIIPLPIYHSGSEMYTRTESGSMLPSMLYSYHCNLPVLSSFFSRTSIPETEELIQVLNAYKNKHDLENLLNSADFLVVKNKEILMPDEERLFRKVQPLFETKALEIGLLARNQLFKKVMDETVVLIKDSPSPANDTSQVVYIRSEVRKPFLRSSLNDYEVVYTLDSNKLKTGTYILSLHYYYTEKTHRAIACNLIISRLLDNNGEWFMNTPLKYFSGFYNGYAVYEQKLEINGSGKYEFILKGTSGEDYRVSDFMLRPENKSVQMIHEKDTLVNNFAY